MLLLLLLPDSLCDQSFLNRQKLLQFYYICLENYKPLQAALKRAMKFFSVTENSII